MNDVSIHSSPSRENAFDVGRVPVKTFNGLLFCFAKVFGLKLSNTAVSHQCIIVVWLFAQALISAGQTLHKNTDFVHNIVCICMCVCMYV